MAPDECKGPIDFNNEKYKAVIDTIATNPDADLGGLLQNFTQHEQAELLGYKAFLKNVRFLASKEQIELVKEAIELRQTTRPDNYLTNLRNCTSFALKYCVAASLMDVELSKILELYGSAQNFIQSYASFGEGCLEKRVSDALNSRVDREIEKIDELAKSKKSSDEILFVHCNKLREAISNFNSPPVSRLREKIEATLKASKLGLVFYAANDLLQLVSIANDANSLEKFLKQEYELKFLPSDFLNTYVGPLRELYARECELREKKAKPKEIEILSKRLEKAKKDLLRGIDLTLCEITKKLDNAENFVKSLEAAEAKIKAGADSSEKEQPAPALVAVAIPPETSRAQGPFKKKKIRRLIEAPQIERPNLEEKIKEEEELEEAKEKSEEPEKPKKECPTCGLEMDKDASECSACGELFEKAFYTPTAAPSALEICKRCATCAAMNPLDKELCIDCGEKLPPAISCSGCANMIPGDAKFCPVCGKPA